MLQGIPSTTTAINRTNGFKFAIQNHKNIRVTTKVANYSRVEAIHVLQELLQKGQTFDAIYAQNDAMAAGTRVVLKRAGINPADIPTVGIDYLPETRTAILNGEQLASFTYPTCGKAGVKVAMDILNGKSVPRYIKVDSQLVTRENAEQIEPVY